VPHISLVFREMWDTAAVNSPLFNSNPQRPVSEDRPSGE
jgi:hypothetical protein